jgi:hypothetical protein
VDTFAPSAGIGIYTNDQPFDFKVVFPEFGEDHKN